MTEPAEPEVAMEVDEDQAPTYDSDEEGGVRIDPDIYIPPPPRKMTQHSASDPRLIISKISNKNFKSYAGTVEIGPFNVCFSSIVGPNGSGKSNVIDSMLFVFGYRATKIRSKKISSLIHSSTEHPDCSSCTVAVHFRKVMDRPNEEYEEVPGSEIIISRTAFKDSSSFYELNGRKVQFKEIAKLLRREGVDLDHNRFLILQGEVEQIALMKPKAQNENDTGMLEFLEDIIGTTRYKEPLAKLIAKVEDLSERVVERTNRLRIAEKDRETLREPMQEAVAYLKVENTIFKLRHKLNFCKKIDTLATVKNKESAHKDLEKDLNDLKAEMEKVHEKKDGIHTELKEKCKKWDAIQQKKDAATEKFNEFTKNDAANHHESSETNKRRKSNKAAVEAEQSKLEELARIPEKHAEGIEECETLIKKHSTKKEKEEEQLKELMASLKEKTKPLMDKRAELEKKLIDYKKNVNEAKATFDLAESELQIYTSVEQTEKEKFEKIRETLQQKAETLEDRTKQLEVLKKKIPTTQKSLHESKAELSQAINDEAVAGAKLKTLRVQFDNQKSAMHANKSRNAVLDFLMQQKREGRINGVIGRLGDLGAVDAKYDIAVSTACGVLDHIVVDTVDTAQKCIEHLRRSNVGRANFIPLEKQQHLVEACGRKIRTPENVIRVFDIIKVEDERMLPAFYFGLRDTLLAENLEQGSRIAYGATRWRVVTLEGQLIETAGTMSGGGRPSKGRIGQRVVRNEPSANDIEKLESDLQKVYDDFNRLKAKQRPLDEQIRHLEPALQEMLLNRDKFEIEIETIKQQAPSLKQQLKVQEKKVAESKSSPEKVRKLTGAVEKARENLEKKQKDSRATEEAVQDVNEQIEELSGGRVKEQQKKIADLAKGIDKARKEICRLQVGIKTAERDTQKTTKRIEQLQTDIKVCETRIKELFKQKEELEAAGRALLDELKEYDEALKERDAAGASLKGQISKLQERENTMKAMKIDLDQKVKASAAVISELTNKIARYEREIRSVKLNPIPEEPEEELPEYTDEQVANFDTRTVANNLAAAEERLPREIPNMQTIKDYLEKDKIFIARSESLHEATQIRNKMRNAYDEARKRRATEFHAGFNVITSKLKSMYQMITLGGAAELELVDSLDPFTEGITFSVRPPKKSWKNISNLSGGEKTLSSLALVFALHHYKPTPLYFMDEIDAALDFKNVSIVGRYIKDRTKNAQFIVISLRSEMFELADTLIGIYKTYNSTKCIPVDMKKVYAAHPEIAERERLKANDRKMGGRGSLTQVPGPSDRSRNAAKMPLTCPAVLENQSQSSEDEDNQGRSGPRSISPIARARSQEQRRPSIGETPVTSRRSTRNSRS